MDERFADAVVVAAGASRRMNGKDKLEADLGGRPLLAWAVDALASAHSVRRVVIVAAAERVDGLARADWVRGAAARVVAGGGERGDSVLAGVRATDAPIVLVHDGARPLVSPGLVDSVAQAARASGAAVPVIAVADSLKSVEGDTVTGVVERDGLAAAQTPQGVRRELLLDAFAAAGGQTYGDEAALLAAHGVRIATVPGESTNIKVTRPGDLEVVRAVALARGGSLGSVRTGFGQDSHQFGREDGLWLGGVLIAEAPRLHGHSDGDVVLHALATALLSAAGLGDLGRLFPAGERNTAGAASTELLHEAVVRAREGGWRPATARISLLGARPRLGAGRMDAMRRAVADALGLEAEAVSITASSGNLSGAEGSGRAISATALVTAVTA